MKVIRTDQLSEKPATNPLFIGGPVTYQHLLSRHMGSDLSMISVTFGKGVRMKLHSHDSAQVLFVTAGKGMVVTEEGQSIVSVGDIVYSPAGEKHWHGATGDSEFSHIALQLADSKITQLED